MAVPTANASVVQIEIRQAAVHRILRGMFQHVSDAADGVNQGAQSFPVNFAAEPVNVHVHNVSCGIDAHAPHVIKDHAASNDPAGIATEILQERC